MNTPKDLQGLLIQLRGNEKLKGVCNTSALNAGLDPQQIREDIMWRRLFKIFGAKVVITTDMGGEERVRFAFKHPNGGYRCRKIHGFLRMKEDGTFYKDCYVDSWEWV